MGDVPEDDLVELEIADESVYFPESAAKSGRIASLSSAGSATGSLRKKTGLLVRAKKWGATRSVKTVGSKIIVQALGEDGKKLFNGIIDFAKIFFGEKEGAQMAEDALVIVVKVRILIDDQLMSIDLFRDSEEILHTLLFEVQKVFDTAAALDDKKSDEPINPIQLSSILFQIRDTWRDIFVTLMQEKNLIKFTNLLSRLGDIEFLHAFLNDLQYRKLRMDVESSFSSLMQNVHLRDQKLERNCRFANCPQPAVRSQALFRSAGFCAAHHLEHYQPVFLDPELHHFIAEEEQNTVFFLDHLKRSKSVDSDPLQAYTLTVIIQQWKAITSKEMRLKRAKILASKYIDPSSPSAFNFPSEIIEPLLKDLDSRNSKSSKLPFEYFDQILKCCMEILQSQFKSFVESSDYERFLASTTLPKEEMNALRKYSRAPPRCNPGTLRKIPES